MRGGLLGQGSVLIVTSYPDRTAPVAARRLGAREPARHAAAATAAEHPAAAGHRRHRHPAHDARADGDAPAEPGLRHLPRAHGSARLLARELRRDRPLAHPRRQPSDRRRVHVRRRHADRRRGRAAPLHPARTRTTTWRRSSARCSPTPSAGTSTTATCRRFVASSARRPRATSAGRRSSSASSRARPFRWGFRRHDDHQKSAVPPHRAQGARRGPAAAVPRRDGAGAHRAASSRRRNRVCASGRSTRRTASFRRSGSRPASAGTSTFSPSLMPLERFRQDLTDHQRPRQRATGAARRDAVQQPRGRQHALPHRRHAQPIAACRRVDRPAGREGAESGHGRCRRSSSRSSPWTPGSSCDFGRSCVYTGTIAWAGPTSAAADGARPERRVRAAVRRRCRRRQRHASCARGSEGQHARLVARRGGDGCGNPSSATTARVSRLSRQRARRRAAHPEGAGQPRGAAVVRPARRRARERSTSTRS